MRLVGLVAHIARAHHRHHRQHHGERVAAGLDHLEHELVANLASGAGAAALTWLALAAVCRHTRLRWTWAAALAPLAVAVAAVAAPRGGPAALGASVGAVLACAWLGEGERRDERRGGERRRRARSKHGPWHVISAWLERRRVAAGPLGAVDLVGARLWPAFWRRGEPRVALGLETRTRRPVWLRLSQLRKHTLVLGATGGGKSNTLTWLVTRMVRAGYGAVFLDMKGDPYLRERLAVEAGLCGRPFYLFRIEDEGQHYNPLRRGDATARRDRLVASQAFSEDYYRGLFATHAKVVLDALDAVGREATIAALAEHWDPEDLKGVVRQIADEGRRLALVRYLERLPSAQSEHIRSSRARVTEVADTTAAARLCAGSSEADEIELGRALRRAAVVCFSLNADSYPGAAATLGNLILQDLIGLVGESRQACTPIHAIVAIDEFGALHGEQLGRLLSTARDVEAPTVLGGQDLAQLRRISEHFEAEVKANVCAVIAHRQSEPDSAEQVSRIAGTEEVVEQTQQLDRRRPGMHRATDIRDETGAGSQHYERRFRFGPDEVKDLEIGEAVVRVSHPASAHKLLVYRCESTEEAATVARVRRADGQLEAADPSALLWIGESARDSLARD
jgi:hypothetical protein